MDLLGLFRKSPAAVPDQGRDELRPISPRLAHTRRGSRGYDAAQVTNLTHSMVGSTVTPYELLRRDLRRTRARSRDLSNNESLLRMYYSQLDRNVVGPSGVVMRPDVRNGKVSDGIANEALSAGWKRFSRDCDYLGEMTLTEAQRVAMRTVAEDGEVFIQHVVGRDAGPFGYQFLLIDPERVNVDHNVDLGRGRHVRLGIEYDAAGRRVAYHVKVATPGDGTYAFGGGDYKPIPASEIIHLFLRERVGQERGIPWSAANIIRLAMLHGYSEAAVVNARVAAAKYPVIQAGEFAQEFIGDDVDEDGNPIIEAGNAGEPLVLPQGYTLANWDPAYPQAEFSDFVRSQKGDIAAGFSLTYPTMTGELKEVSFSGLRHGQASERDMWIVLQDFLITKMLEPIYRKWLPAALLSQQLTIGSKPLKISNIDRYENVKWYGRRWSAVDPQKEAAANKERLVMGLTSELRLCAEENVDYEDIVAEQKKAQEIREKAGLRPTTDPKPAAPPQPEGGGDAQDDS